MLKLRKVNNTNTIYNEDCFNTMSRLKDNSIEVILTSPPYNNSRKRKSEKCRSSHISRYDIHIDNGTQEDYCNMTERLFKEFDRILTPNGVVLYNLSYGTDSENGCSANDLIDVLHRITHETGFMIADIIVWKKSNALPNNTSHNKLTRIWEFVFVFCRETEISTFLANKGVSNTSKTGQKYYYSIDNFIEAPNNDGSCELNKATFSSKLVFDLLKKYCGVKNATVYDPFMGTGTTAVGVIKYNKISNLNLNYLGSELSEKQCEYAENRIRKELD